MLYSWPILVVASSACTADRSVIEKSLSEVSPTGTAVISAPFNV